MQSIFTEYEFEAVKCSCCNREEGKERKGGGVRKREGGKRERVGKEDLAMLPYSRKFSGGAKFRYFRGPV